MIGCYRCLKPATWIAISAARSFKSGDMVGFETPQCDDHKHGNKFRRITETMEIHDFLEHRGKSPTITEHLEFELMFTRKCLSGLKIGRAHV